jgi:hypothetical protein
MDNTKTVYCYSCGEKFTAKRITAKYCSNVCKTSWHRNGSDLYQNLNVARYSLKEAIDLVKKNPHWGTTEVYEAIEELRTLVSRLDMNQLDQSKERVDDYPLHPDKSFADSN